MQSDYLTTFEVSNILGAAEVVAKIGSSSQSNNQIKLSLSKTLIHISVFHSHCCKYM